MLLAVAACSTTGPPGEPVAAAVGGRPDATEPGRGEPAGFKAPASVESASTEPAPRESPESGGPLPGIDGLDDVVPGSPAFETVAPTSPEPAESCHPAYYPCLPHLPGDALDCSDLDDDVKSVVVLDPADDPYRLAGDASGRACLAGGFTGLVTEGSSGGARGEVSRSSGDVGSGGDAERPLRTPSWTPDLEPPDVDNVGAVCGPGSEPSGFGPVGGVPPEPEPDGVPPGSDGESLPGESQLPEPAPDEVPPASDSQEELPPESPPESDDVAEELVSPPDELGEVDLEPDGESPQESELWGAVAAAGDEWCLPEITDDTVRLFWCENDLSSSSDLEVYEVGATPTYRTRPLALEVGTHIERYSTCTGLNAVEEVVGFVELSAIAADEPLIGVHLCGRFFLGEELYAWGLGLYRVWQDSEGRYRIEMPRPVEYLDIC